MFDVTKITNTYYPNQAHWHWCVNENLEFLSRIFFFKKQNELNPRRRNVYFGMKLEMFSINSTQRNIINHLIDFSL